MERRFTLGRGLHSEKSVHQASTSALAAPPPRDGEVRRTALPDTFDGIRFEIGRMIRYVQASVKDPVIRDHSRAVCENYAGMAEASARMQGSSLEGVDDRALCIEAIDAWCRDHFCYVNDPPNVEVIQTPRRMVKATKVPPQVLKALMAPFYEAMKAVADPAAVEAYEPPGTCIGDCDEAAGLYAAQCATAPCEKPIAPIEFRFGGHDGTLHHVWGYVGYDGKMVDSDLTEAGYKLGDHSQFSHYEEVEIPL